MSFDKKLAKAAKLWKAAQKMKPEFDNVVTDGIYTGKLIKAEMGESQKGRLQVCFRVEVAGGEYKGEKVTWYSGLETENNMMYFQRDIVRLGKEVPEDPSDLEGVLKELEKEKPVIRIQLKTSGEFQNVRILKLVEDADEEVETDEEVEEEVEEDEAEEESDDEEAEDEESDDEDDEEAAEEESEEEDDEDEEDETSQESEDDADAEDEESDDDDSKSDETPEVEVGMRVSAEYKGKTVIGVVKEIDYKKEIVKIKTDKGILIKVSPDALSPAPQTKVKKK